SLEKFFVEGDVLDADEPSRALLEDLIDQLRWIPVTDPIEQDWDVDAQRDLLCGGSRSGFSTRKSLFVEAAHRFEREVDARVARHDARVGGAQQQVQVVLADDVVEDREQLL